MTSLMRPEGNQRSLLLGGLVAVSLHALVLASLHLRDREPSSPGPLRSKDNTAELLQFSTQSVSLGRLSGRDLPSSLPLPPPPDLLSPSNLFRKGPSRAVAAGRVRGLQPHRAGSSKAGLLAQRFGVSRGSALERQGATGVSGATAVVPRAVAAGKFDLSGDWAVAMERLRAVVRQERSSSESSLGAVVDSAHDTTVAQAGRIVQLASNSPLRELYRSLWTQADPISVQLPIRASGNTTVPVDVRQVSWQQVRASELSIRHGQFVVMPEKVLLFWLQGEHLYLLQSPSQWNSNSSSKSNSKSNSSS